MASSETIPARPVRAKAEGAGWRLGLVIAAAGLFLFFWQMSREIPDVMRLALPDADDALRLTDIRDFLAGQGWFDMTQYRYLPPNGVTLHWSRLVEPPIVGGILGLTPLLGRELAEKVTVIAWPLVLFLVYAGVIGWGSSRLFSARAAGFAIFVAAQMIVFRDLFAPGRIDHHNVEVILVAFSAIGFGLSDRSRNAALASGIASALSLAVVLETLPFVAVIALAFAVAWIVRGKRAAPALLFFGIGFATAALAGFLADNGPSQWLTPACDRLSAPWLALCVGEGAIATALALASARLRTWPVRLVAGGAIGAVPPALFALFNPACLHGFYATMPEPYLSELLSQTVEAFPFWRFLEVNPIPGFQSVPPLLVGAIVTTVAALRGRGDARPMLALLAALLWLGVLGAQVQIRIVYVASAFLPLAAGWFLDWILAGDAARRSTALRLSSATGAFLLFGIVWAVIGNAAQSLAAGRFDPAPAGKPCSDPRSLTPLNQLPPGLVLAQPGLGPTLLLHTHHSIMVAGYHRATEGVIAGFKAFAGSEADMRGQVDKYGVDYVALCQSWLVPPEKARPFARELTDGREVPWLQPLDLGTGPLQVWRVVKDR